MVESLLQLTTAVTTLFHLVDIDIVVYQDDRTILFSSERNHLPEFLKNFEQSDFNKGSFIEEQERVPFLLYTNALGLSYISGLVEMEEANAKRWMAGPFLIQSPDMERIDAAFPMEQTTRLEFIDFVGGLKFMKKAQIQSVINYMQAANAVEVMSYETVSAQDLKQADAKHAHSSFFLQQPDDDVIKGIEFMYKVEKEMMYAVEKGNKKKMKEMYADSKHVDAIMERFPNQPVRALKNLLVILNTLLRVAAENGKVHPYYLHFISERFSKQIEKSESINALNELRVLMCDEYCDLVNERAMKGYSALVQAAAQYLSVFYRKAFHLEEIAEHCIVHPSHLSRQFRKETGQTLNEFQNKLRCDEAKLLLHQHPRTSIDWIAGQVGFEDAGYFARIFKKIVGVSPTAYRNTKQLKRTVEHRDYRTLS